MMADDEKQNETSEESAEISAQDETTPPAGPVDAEGPDDGSAEETAAEPPAAEQDEDTSEATSKSDDATPSEEAADAEQGEVDPPAADAEQSTRAEDDDGEELAEDAATEQEEPESEAAAADMPAAKEKKADVIPGADLEPIAVEEEERPLSAEEQARREAEEEERARREAELTGDSEEEQPATPAPAKLEGDARYLATGKRKSAIARVTLLPGNGEIVINRRPLEEFFPRPLHQTMARQPLSTTGYEGSVDVRVRVHGGGIGGQAGAVRHGIARALTEVDPELRSELKRRGFLTRDARVKERRKAGLKKARKRPQFSKR